MSSSFSFKKAAEWDACACCSSKENLKVLNVTYAGGKHGHETTLCEDCLKQLEDFLYAERSLEEKKAPTNGELASLLDAAVYEFNVSGKTVEHLGMMRDLYHYFPKDKLDTYVYDYGNTSSSDPRFGIWALTETEFVEKYRLPDSKVREDKEEEKKLLMEAGGEDYLEAHPEWDRELCEWRLENRIASLTARSAKRFLAERRA